MEEHDEITITLRITAEQGQELLRRLAEDDEFRRELERNPAEVLSGYGIEISPAEAIPSTASLASKEEIALLIGAMGERDDPFGRVSEHAWRYHLLGKVFAFGALPMIGRGGPA